MNHPPESVPRWVPAILRRALATRFVKDAGTLAGAQFLVALLAFVQGIVVASILGPEDYGIALLIISVPTMLFSFLDARTSAAAVKFLSQFQSDGAAEKSRAMCRLAYGVDMAIAVLTLALVVGTAPWAEEKVVHSTGVTGLMIAYATAFLPRSLTGTSQSVLSVTGGFRSMAMAQLAAKAVGVFAVLGLVLTGWGIHGVIYGRMAELVVGGLSLGLLAHRAIQRNFGGHWMRGRFQALRGHLREIFRFLGFTELTELVNVLTKQADMVVLGYFGGPEQAGYFGLAKRMTGVVSMVVQPLQSVLYPRLAKSWAQRDRVAVRRTLRRYSLGMGVPLAGLVLLALPLVWPFIHFVVGSEFDPAVPVAQLIFASTALWLACSALRPLFHAMGEVRFLLLNATLVNGLSLIAFVVAARFGGALGIAWVHFLIGGLLGQGIALAYAARKLHAGQDEGVAAVGVAAVGGAGVGGAGVGGAAVGGAAEPEVGAEEPRLDGVHVVFVNYKALPSIGGKQTYTDTLARKLVERGARVTVLAKATPRPEEPIPQPYRTVYRPGWKTLWRAVAGADVLHFNAFTWGSWFVGWIQGRPMIWVYHETADRLCARAMGWKFWQRRCGFHPATPCLWCGQLSFWRTPRHWWLDPWQQKTIERFDAIVSPVEWWRERMPPRTIYLPHGIDLSAFHPSAVAPRRDFFLFVGRVVADKGVDVLLEALAECRKRGQLIRTVVVGGGSDRDAYERRAADLGLADLIEFAGPVADEDLVGYYQDALALVVPSMWEEMFGLVAIEAMACRTAVIASAIGGLNDTAGRAGLVFPAGDASALAACMTRLMEDPGFAEELAERGYRFVRERHDLERAARSYAALYRRHVPRRSPEAMAGAATAVAASASAATRSGR